MKITLEINIPDQFDEAEAKEILNDLIDTGELEREIAQILMDEGCERE